MATSLPKDEPRERPILCLSGFMGVGKTTLGRALALHLGLPFFDLDECVEVATGLPVAELFATEGEAAFRQREAVQLRELLSTGRRCVVALGGGTLLDGVLQAEALRASFVMLLAASPEAILERVRGTNRPLLGASPELTLPELLRRRASVYRQAHATLATDGLSVEAAVSALRSAWPGGI